MTRLSYRALSIGLAGALLYAPLALAQPMPDHGNGNQMPQGNMNQTPPEHMAPMQRPPQPQGQHYDNNDNNHGMMDQHGPQMGHGDAGNHQWRHGQRYNGHRQVVHNWNQYHLRQPPHGYEWVQDGGQFVLIGIASGIIAEVLVNSLSH